MNSRASKSVAIAAAVGLSLPAFARAQAPSDSVANAPTTTAAMKSSSATMLRGGEVGELLSVYVPRDPSEVQRALEYAQFLERSAASEIDETRSLSSEADGRARIMKEEMQTTKVKRDVAKKAKDPTAQADLNATYKRQTREQSYLVHLRDALRADADRMEAERSAASARVKSLELEVRVAQKQAELSGGTPSGEDVSQYRSMLKAMLDAQRQAADRSRDASDKRKRVADRRIKQLAALSKISKS